MPSVPSGLKPLRRQLVAIMFAAILPLLLALAYLMWREAAELRTHAEHRAIDLASFAARNSEHFLAQTETLLAGLARREDVRRLDSRACGPVFATFADQNPRYANLLSIDAEGGVVCSARSLSKPLPMKIGPLYLVDQMKTSMAFLVGRVEKGFITGRWVVPIAYPIRDGDRLIGMVGVSVDLAQFDPFFALTSELNGRMTLLDENGSVLADSLERGGAIGRQLEDDATRRMLAEGEGLLRAPGFDGIDRIHGFSRIQGAGWTAVAGIRMDSVIEPMLADFRKLGVLVIGMLGISLILGWLLIRRIEGAATSLVATARSVATGRLCDRADAIPVAELNEVGEQFNRMLDKLAAERQALEESRAQRVQIYQASPDAIIVTRLDDGVTLEANQAFYDATGYAEAEVLGRTSLEIGFIRDMAARRRIVERLRRKGKIANEGFWGACKDGSRRYFLFSARLVRLGGAECEIAVMRDTTEARRMQIALRENEARFQALTRLSSDWYWEQDADFRFVKIAGPLFEHTGIPTEAHLGRTRWEIPSRGMTEEAWQRHKAQLQRHEPFRDLEMQRIGANGAAHWVSISGEPVFDSQGVFSGYRGVGRDITERKCQQFIAELGSRVLEMSARRLPLDVVLDTIVRELEGHEPAMLCSILLLDADGLHLRHGAAPSLAEEYNRAIDGVAIGPTVGSCGTAAYSGREVVVSDIATDPLWADFKHLALPHGLRACWSTPILSAAREVLGTFAVYFVEARKPRADEENTVARVAELASIVIERDRFEAELLRLSRAIEQSPVSIIITDTDGRIEYVNPKFVATTGYSADEVRGQNPRILKSGETSAEEYARLWQALTQGREWSGELHNRRKDGTLFWEQAHIMPVVTHAGKIINYLAVKEDITVRKAAQAALHAMAEERDHLLRRLQLEFDHMPIGFVVTDPALRIIDWNPAMERIFGHSREEAIGANALDLLVPAALRFSAERHIEEVCRSRMTIVETGRTRQRTAAPFFANGPIPRCSMRKAASSA